MINWLRNRIKNFLYPGEPGLNPLGVVPRIKSKATNKSTLSIRESIGLDDHDHNPIRFNVYNANGGKIVETKVYDEKNDRWISSLHVIDSSEDFGESVGKIVFMELLKKG